MARFELITKVSISLIPSSRALASVYFKGALARYEGKPRCDNPYKWGGGFRNAWDRGWCNVNDGHVEVKRID